MNRIALLVGWLLISAVASAQELLTLDKAIETALDRNQSIRGAASDRESTRWGKLNAVSNFLPKVQIDAGLTRIDPESERRANAAITFINAAAGALGIPQSVLADIKPFAYRDTYASTITVVQPIFNGGAEILGVRAADIVNDRSEYSYQDTEQDVIARVKTSYYGVLGALELVGLAEENIDRTKRYLETTRRREDLGMRTKTDVVRWEVQLASDEGNLIKVQNLLAATRLQLNEVMGVELDKEWALQKIVPADSAIAGSSTPTHRSLLTPLRPVPETTAITPSLLEMHPSWRVMNANLRLAETNIDRSWTNFLPRINLAFQYGWEKNNTVALDGIRPWAISLSISLPVFNGFGDYANLQRAREDLKRSEAQAESFRRGMMMQATNAHLSVRAAKQRISVAQKAQDQSLEVLNSVTRRYETGGASNVDLIDVQTAYISAKVNYVTAMYDYYVAEVQLARATGTISR